MMQLYPFLRIKWIPATRIPATSCELNHSLPRFAPDFQVANYSLIQNSILISILRSVERSACDTLVDKIGNIGKYIKETKSGMSIFVPNICGDETSYVLLFYKHITKFLTIKKKVYKGCSQRYCKTCSQWMIYSELTIFKISTLLALES